MKKTFLEFVTTAYLLPNQVIPFSPTGRLLFWVSLVLVLILIIEPDPVPLIGTFESLKGSYIGAFMTAFIAMIYDGAWNYRHQQ